MAVDSALKRGSATFVIMPFRGWVFPGTSGVSQVERQAAGYSYSGISSVKGKVWWTRNPNVFEYMEYNQGEPQWR